MVVTGACGSQLLNQHLDQHALRLKAAVTRMDVEGLVSSDKNTAFRVQGIL